MIIQFIVRNLPCALLCTFLDNDWRCDQYRWSNEGVHKLPRNNPRVKKWYFYIDTPEGRNKGFQKHAYQLLAKPETTLVHYIGDHKLAVAFPHGNAHKQAKEYTRTMPSVLSALKIDTMSSKANVVYKKHVASSQAPLTHASTAMPRNMQQVRNIRQNALHRTRLSRDTLYNIHDIAYDTTSYIFRITTYPDLEVIFGLRGILDHMECILQVDSRDQLLSYDTTFQLGDFYISTLVFRHTAFVEKPCIPAMFLLHERKLTTTHAHFFQELKLQVRNYTHVTHVRT